MVWNYKNDGYCLRKKNYCVICYNFRQTFVPYSEHVFCGGSVDIARTRVRGLQCKQTRVQNYATQLAAMSVANYIVKNITWRYIPGVTGSTTAQLSSVRFVWFERGLRLSCWWSRLVIQKCRTFAPKTSAAALPQNHHRAVWTLPPKRLPGGNLPVKSFRRGRNFTSKNPLERRISTAKIHRPAYY